jgi:hypothetical protein
MNERSLNRNGIVIVEQVNRQHPFISPDAPCWRVSGFHTTPIDRHFPLAVVIQIDLDRQLDEIQHPSLNRVPSE